MFCLPRVSQEVTQSDTQTEGDGRAAQPPLVLALVVALCADEPERAGEVAMPPPGDPGPEVVWGRAGAPTEERRMIFQRHRPGRVSPRGELISLKVSRDQLRVRARRADVRLVGATNRHESAIKHDLLARFSLRIHVPGLDERPEDIPLMASHLLRFMADEDPALRARFIVERAGQRHPRMSPSLMRDLLRRAYPTNVRELQGLLWEAIADSPEGRIGALPRRLAASLGQNTICVTTHLHAKNPLALLLHADLHPEDPPQQLGLRRRVRRGGHRPERPAAGQRHR